MELHTGVFGAPGGADVAVTCEVTGDWADLSGVPGGASAWAHGGVAATLSGEVLGFHAGWLVVFDRRGAVQRLAATDLVEGHGLAAVVEEDEELVWVCDPGFAFTCTGDWEDEGLAALFGKGIRQESGAPRVVKMRLDGGIVFELPLPSDAVSYAPTAVVVDDERFGGTGDVWVADGYGQGVVHRFDASGRHVSAISGETGAGRFDCPHALLLDRRAPWTPELYVTERGNSRVQVYDLEGRYLRSFGEGALNSPSALARWGDLLVVAELFGRLAAFDTDERFVGYLGASPDAEVDAERGWPARPGWPNHLAADGRATPPPVVPGTFTAPHSLAVDADGALYVSEWLLGGRYHQLIRHDARSGGAPGASERTRP